MTAGPFCQSKAWFLVDVAESKRLIAMQSKVEIEQLAKSAVGYTDIVTGSMLPNDDVARRPSEIVTWKYPVTSFEWERNGDRAIHPVGASQVIECRVARTKDGQVIFAVKIVIARNGHVV